MYTDDPTRIRHMLDAANEINVLRVGYSREALEQDRLASVGFLHSVQIIGEASRLVSTPLKDAHPELPWVRIQGMRHRIVHNYTQVDSRLLWEAITIHIPALIPQLEAILGESF